ncbi:MAG: ATP-binding cassette domain-containing protein, partial [Candidatus Aenigmatarchaeota archaeon]
LMTNAIEVRNVSKRFTWRGGRLWSKKKKIQALSNVSFNVKHGEIFALLGPNGAGKSTMMNILIGLLLPNNGSVQVLGKDMLKDRSTLREINYTSADSTFHWILSVQDVMEFGAKVYDIPKEKRELIIS